MMGRLERDPERYRILAGAALRELAKPSPAMISVAYEAVRFDENWAINTGRDFEKAVKAMIDAASSKAPHIAASARRLDQPSRIEFDPAQDRFSPLFI